MNDDLIDTIIADESPSQISDKIKDILYAKSAEKLEASRPKVANSMFAGIIGSEESEDS
jgi:hypothetical protein